MKPKEKDNPPDILAFERLLGGLVKVPKKELDTEVRKYREKKAAGPGRKK